MRYKYKHIRGQIQTFGYLNCIDKLTWHPKTWIMRLIGHTARVFRDEKTNELFVYESTTLNKGRSGVMLTPFVEWLKSKKHQRVFYKGCYFVREKEDKTAKIWYRMHVTKHLGIPYPDLKQWKWRWYLANAAIDFGVTPLENVHQKKMMFCTQLSADLDRCCSIIHIDENPAEWEPDDCRDDGRLANVQTDKVVIKNEIEIYYG